MDVFMVIERAFDPCECDCGCRSCSVEVHLARTYKEAVTWIEARARVCGELKWDKRRMEAAAFLHEWEIEQRTL